MSGKVEYVLTVVSILNLGKCKVTILPHGAREEGQYRKTAKCVVPSVTAEKAINKD